MKMFGKRPALEPALGEPPDAVNCDDRLVYDADVMDEYIARLETRIAVLEAQLAARPATDRLRARMDVVRRRLVAPSVDRREAPFAWLDDAERTTEDVDFWERKFDDADFLMEVGQL